MKTITTVFKVVSRKVGRKCSYNQPMGKSVNRFYSTKKWTKPIPGTPLFAFSSLKSVKKHFGAYFDDKEVWEALAVNVRSKFVVPSGISSIFVSTTVKSVKEDWNMERDSSIGAIFPVGTVFCDAIKLVKRVN